MPFSKVVGGSCGCSAAEHQCRIQQCYPLQRPIEQTDSCGQVENIVGFFQKLLMVALPFTTVLSVVLVWQVPILEQWLMVA